MYKWRQQPIVSIILVAANVLLFLLCKLAGGIIYDWGILDVYGVIFGEYYRFISYMFLHADLDHLVSNMLILFFLGSMIEKEIGHVCYGSLYMLCGFGAGLCSYFYRLFTGNLAYTLGASGAVFGLEGVLLAMVLFRDRRTMGIRTDRVVLMILLSLYSGFAGQNIDNAAHVGGLLTGVACGCAMCLFRRIRYRIKKRKQTVR